MHQTIAITLHRDQARAVQETFLPYMAMLCQTHIRNADGEELRIFNCRAVHCLFLAIEMKFYAKLNTKALNLRFKFTYAEALAFYTLLEDLPLNANQEWLVSLRELIREDLHTKLSEP